MSERVIEVVAEKAVAGGLTLCRHQGKVVLASGAIPGERVRLEVERATKQVIFARTIGVIEASPFRREPPCDPACGGLAYAHVAYAHQLALKAEVVADTFRRVGKLPLDAPVVVEPSAETGYRMRARLHVRGRQVGFFREGSHQLCDAGPTGQLLPASMAAVRALVDSFGARADACDAVTVSENVPGTERVVHLEMGDRSVEVMADVAALPSGVTGVTAVRRGRVVLLAGDPYVRDGAAALCSPEVSLPASVTWRRSATSFFQGNRYVTGRLLAGVLEGAEGASRVVDLYAGVGLFAVALAARGASVLAVEHDPSSVADLEVNAEPWSERLGTSAVSVEEALAGAPQDEIDVVVADPPRTGLSREALAGLIRVRAARVVYVSCDPPTLARDAHALAAAGYRLASVRGYDMFPQTPHIETVAVFDRVTS